MIGNIGNVEMWKYPVSNIQYPLFNDGGANWILAVGCWIFASLSGLKFYCMLLDDYHDTWTHYEFKPGIVFYQFIPSIERIFKSENC